MIAPKGSKQVHIPRVDLQKHVTLVGCVNAEGRVSAPTVIVEAKKVRSEWTHGWTQAYWVADEVGFCSTEIFYGWAERWIQDSKPPGEESQNPRILLFDNYHSHLSPEVIQMFRSHNVRCITLPPHSTHILCVLDTSVFGGVKKKFKELCSKFGAQLVMEKLGGIIRESYSFATKITLDPVTGAKDCAASNGFRATGIYPFDPSKGLKEKFFLASDAYKKNAALSLQKAGKAPAPRISALLTKEDGQKIANDFEAQCLAVQLGTNAEFRVRGSARPQQFSEIVTGDWYITNAIAVQKAKKDQEQAKADRKAASKVKAAQRLADKEAASARRIAKAAEKAEKAERARLDAIAVQLAAGTAPKSNPKAKKGKKRPSIPPAPRIEAAAGAFVPRKRAKTAT